MPRVFTPTCETCTNECGAGPEIRFVLTGLEGGGADGFVVVVAVAAAVVVVGAVLALALSLFIELARKGRKTARGRCSQRRRPTNGQATRTMTSRAFNHLFEKDGRLVVIVETEPKHARLSRRGGADMSATVQNTAHVTDTHRARKVVEKRLVLVVLEYLGDRKHPHHPVRLDIH